MMMSRMGKKWCLPILKSIRFSTSNPPGINVRPLACKGGMIFSKCSRAETLFS